MSHKVTLGGDRLGSGKKMKVEIHGFERSTHDLSYIWRSTMSAGTLVPFIVEPALPGDTFDIHLNCDIKTHPTVGPLFGSYKVQLDVFQIPIRLYHAALHNNMLKVGMNMASVKLPIMGLTAPIIDPATINDPNFNLDVAQINPSALFHYLGISGCGIVSIEELTPYRLFNALPWLMYWDCYKQYYANKQEEIGAVISIYPSFGNNLTVTGITTTVGTSPSPGTTIPQAPTAVHNVTLSPGSVITLAYTGTPPNPDIIFIQQENTGKKFSLSDLTTFITDTGTTLTGTFDATKFPSYTFRPINWNYIAVGEALNIPPRVETFPLENIDTMRTNILAQPFSSVFNVGNQFLAPYEWSLNSVPTEGKTLPTALFSQEGLALKTYQSDLFNNWLSTEWIDGTGGINEITAIDTTGGSFNLDTLNLSKKVYDMLNAIAVSGGSYNDWVEAVWDQTPFHAPENPVYMGGLIKELVFQEVVSNSESQNGQPLGTLAGKGVMGDKHKGGTVVIRITEPSYVLGIISLTPRIDYSQGNKWHTHLQTLDELHKPHLDEIGFQELITEQMAWYTSYLPIGAAYDVGWVQNSAGKQPAWINYMTNVNQVHGNFAIQDNEMFMTLNRRYEHEIDGTGHVNIKDLTTYIDPVKFNHIFADTAIDAQNFWTQISVDMIARRKMSAKIMPNF